MRHAIGILSAVEPQLNRHGPLAPIRAEPCNAWTGYFPPAEFEQLHANQSSQQPAAISH